jgi:hypothetical protein
MFLIFKDNELHLALSNLSKNYKDNEDFVVVKCLDFDPSYNYSLVDGEAVKGDLIEISTEAEDDWQKTQYQRDRKKEYPSPQEQLDYIYHNGIDAWKSDIIDPIKAKYPKPIKESAE